MTQSYELLVLEEGVGEGVAGEGVGDGFVGAGGEAVEAEHASAHVDGVLLQVDALALAGVDASAALGAAVGVDVDMEGGAARHQSEQCAHGAERVAYQSAALESGHKQPYCHCHRKQGGKADARVDDVGLYG